MEKQYFRPAANQTDILFGIDFVGRILIRPFFMRGQDEVGQRPRSLGLGGLLYPNFMYYVVQYDLNQAERLRNISLVFQY